MFYCLVLFHFVLLCYDLFFCLLLWCFLCFFALLCCFILFGSLLYFLFIYYLFIFYVQCFAALFSFILICICLVLFSNILFIVFFLGTIMFSFPQKQYWASEALTDNAPQLELSRGERRGRIYCLAAFISTPSWLIASRQGVDCRLQEKSFKWAKDWIVHACYTNERLSPESNTYRAHPHRCIHTQPGPQRGPDRSDEIITSR